MAQDGKAMTGGLTHPDLVLLHQYWLSRRQGRAMPRRQDIDPVDMPGRLWPHVMLIDVVRDEARTRFRYRRVGTAFTEAFGRELTNEYLDEALPSRAGYRDYVVDIYNEIVARRVPLYTENTFAFDGQGVPRLTRRLSLPLSTDGETVDIVLVCHIFEYDRTLAAAGGFLVIAGMQELTRLYLES